MLGTDPTKKTLIPREPLQAEVTAKAPDWLRYRREFDVKNYVNDRFNNPVGEDRIDKINPQGYLDKLNAEARAKADEHTALRITQQRPQGDMTRAQYLDSLDPKEREFVSRLPKYQTSLWTDTKRGIQALTETNQAMTVANIARSGDYTSDEKAAMIQANMQNPIGAKFGEALGALSPLAIPGKAVQALYTPDYTLRDAVFGQKNSASIAEDMVMDPLNLAGMGIIGGIGKMARGARGINMATDAAAGASAAHRAPMTVRPGIEARFRERIANFTGDRNQITNDIDRTITDIAENELEEVTLRRVLEYHPEFQWVHDRAYSFGSRRDDFLLDVNEMKRDYDDPWNLTDEEIRSVADETADMLESRFHGRDYVENTREALERTNPRINEEVTRSFNRSFMGRITDHNARPSDIMMAFQTQTNATDDVRRASYENLDQRMVDRLMMQFPQEFELIGQDIFTPIEQVRQAVGGDGLRRIHDHVNWLRSNLSTETPERINEVFINAMEQLPESSLEQQFLLREIRQNPQLYHALVNEDAASLTVYENRYRLGRMPVPTAMQPPPAAINFPLNTSTPSQIHAPNIIIPQAPVEIRNASGMTRTENQLYGLDIDYLNSLSDTQFSDTFTSPKGILLPKLSFDQVLHQKILDETKMQDMTTDEYFNLLNTNKDDLNQTIFNNNRSGTPYEVTKFDKTNDYSGRILFDGPTGPSSFYVNVTPGAFFDDVKDVGSRMYYDAIPGLRMQNTTKTVFGDNKTREKSGSYKSINDYMKSLNLGRVKDGQSGKSPDSLPLWRSYVENDKAGGFFTNKGSDVTGTMKMIAPYTIPLGAGVLSQRDRK